jgi:hypothetical protein
MNPVFFVDGLMEQKFIQNICPKIKVQLTSINGKSVKISAIAKKLASLIRLLGNKYYPIIIFIDREDRNITSKQMITEIKNELKKLNIDLENLRFGVADIMTENWILADWKSFKKNTKTKTKKEFSSFEGKHGTNLIKKYYSNYQKTIDGVELLSKSNCSEMVKNSPSFDSFYSNLDKDLITKYHWFQK